MVVTKEGDLELYAVHDTATHTPWSSRGDLAIGLGRSYTVIPGLHEPEPPPEPWELTTSSYPHSTPRSIQKPLLHDNNPARGRHGAPIPTTFGRGDDDGFPALGGGARNVANLSATRPGTRSRALSPEARRNKFFDHTGVTKRNLVSPSPGRSDTGSKGRHRSISKRHWGYPESSVQHVVEADISMTMRKRVVQGYSLVNVRFLSLYELSIVPLIMLFIAYAQFFCRLRCRL